MKRATISQAKNQLSRLLESVKRGEEVLILERDVPIARIVPADRSDQSNIVSVLDDLERRGVVRRGRKRADPKLTARLGVPPTAEGDILAALLADREEGR